MRGVATGDQAIFVQREAFFRVAGFKNIPFMEDVEISKRLKDISPPIVVTSRVTVPGRHFDEDGFWKTAWEMFQARLRYRFGADPAELAERYAGGHSARTFGGTRDPAFRACAVRAARQLAAGRRPSRARRRRTATALAPEFADHETHERCVAAVESRLRAGCPSAIGACRP
jgi:hypothetical protein